MILPQLKHPKKSRPCVPASWYFDYHIFWGVSLHLQRLHGGGFRRDLINLIFFSVILEIFSSMIECAVLRLQLQLSKTNNKQTGGHLFNERVIAHCLIMAQRQRLVNILLKTAP